MKLQIRIKAIWILCILLFTMGLSAKADLVYQNSPDLLNISSFDEDRVAFQYINQINKEGKPLNLSDSTKDTSLSSLVVIKSDQVYILKDGYDSLRDVDQRKREFRIKLDQFTKRKNFLKEYQDLQRDQARKETDPTYGDKRRLETSEQYRKLFLHYDDTYKAIHSKIQSLGIQEYNIIKFRGKNTPEYREFIQKKENLEKDLVLRFEFLHKALQKELGGNSPQNPASIVSSPPVGENPIQPAVSSSPSDSESLPIILDPGFEKDQVYFTNTMDGKVDYVTFSMSPRTADYERMDTSGATNIANSYTVPFVTVRDRLIKTFVERYKFYYTHRGQSDVKVQTEIKTISAPVEISDNPAALGNGPKAKLESKRITLVTSDGFRYVLEDLDGDGITESFFVSNNSYLFRWDTNTPNIISIQNCKDESILGFMKDLIEDSVQSKLGNIDSIRKGQAPKEVFVSDDDIIRDWEQMISTSTNSK
jgi:hypothetical protein